jgi:hypothetical protein
VIGVLAALIFFAQLRLPDDVRSPLAAATAWLTVVMCLGFLACSSAPGPPRPGDLN